VVRAIPVRFLASDRYCWWQRYLPKLRAEARADTGADQPARIMKVHIFFRTCRAS
jgi:hypothetical protein